MTTLYSLFVEHLRWSGSEPTSLEEFGWGDGTVAVALGCAAFGVCVVASLAIALALTIGHAVR